MSARCLPTAATSSRNYGCPGGAAGDEFALPILVRCTGAATHVVKFAALSDGERECEVHARRACGAARDLDVRAYRFRTV